MTNAPACVCQLDSAEFTEAEQAEDSVFWDKVTKPTGFKSSAAQKEQEVRTRSFILYHQ